MHCGAPINDTIIIITYGNRINQLGSSTTPEVCGTASREFGEICSTLCYCSRAKLVGFTSPTFLYSALHHSHIHTRVSIETSHYSSHSLRWIVVRLVQ